MAKESPEESPQGAQSVATMSFMDVQLMRQDMAYLSHCAFMQAVIKAFSRLGQGGAFVSVAFPELLQLQAQLAHLEKYDRSSELAMGVSSHSLLSPDRIERYRRAYVEFYQLLQTILDDRFDEVYAAELTSYNATWAVVRPNAVPLGRFGADGFPVAEAAPGPG